jgi:protein TonB
MMQAGGAARRERITSGLAMVVLHLLLGYALIIGFRPDLASAPAADELKLFDVAPEQPPPPLAPPVPRRPARAEGAASPPNRTARAAPVVAPRPVLPVTPPPPVVVAPLAGTGRESNAGAAPVVGPGSGSGGVGTGTGSGRGGSGPGGGGLASRSRLIRGRLVSDDYPRRQAAAGAGGTVIVRFTVQTDGSVSGCTTTRSSGNAELDRTTCRLIERRFRYEPARD